MRADWVKIVFLCNAIKTQNSCHGHVRSLGVFSKPDRKRLVRVSNELLSFVKLKFGRTRKRFGTTLLSACVPTAFFFFKLPYTRDKNTRQKLCFLNITRRNTMSIKSENCLLFSQAYTSTLPCPKHFLQYF